MDYRQAIKSTVIYSSFFDFPLFPEEIHFWLIYRHPISLDKIKKHLPRELSPQEQKRRQFLLQNSLAKIDLTHRLAKVLKYLPGLRFVGLTGSVAAKNSKPQDDIDLLIITAPHVLWLVRPFVLLLISLFFRRRHPKENPAQATNAFCPNLWLDTTSFSVPKNKRNLYTAHEILQVLPVLDKDQTHQRFLQANSWSSQFLANAYQARIQESSMSRVIPAKAGIHQIIPKSSTFFLFLAPFNYLFFFLQFLYMFPKRTSEVVHPHAAFLHTTNFSEQLDHFLGRS